MQIQLESRLSLHNFKYLPAYAQYLLGHLREYALYQISLSRELNLPLLKLFKEQKDEQLTTIWMESAKDFLSYLSKNRAEEQIEDALIKWIKNQLPSINKKDIVAEDITLVSYIRKQTFLHFLSDYTQDAKEIIALSQELETYITRYVTDATNTYVDLLQTHIQEQSYLTEKITNTSPGIIYLFNIATRSITFANQTAEEFFGLSANEIKSIGNAVLHKLLHPEDVAITQEQLNKIASSTNDENWTIELRLKNAANEYIWMRNYINVFKRNAQEVPIEIIGNLLNIHAEKETEKQLKQSEERYRQAAQLSHIGHFTLRLETNDIVFTEELNRIYDLDQHKKVHRYEDIIRFRHRDDINNAREHLEDAINNQKPFNFYFRIITKNGNEKILHTQGGPVVDNNGKTIELVGTVQDVSERQNLIQQLQQSEQLYKQAEQLAKLGNWVWDLETNKLTWSDELYRMYQLEPGTPISLGDLRKFNDPDYRLMIDRIMKQSIEKLEPHDFHYRIILSNGEKKVLQAKGQPIADERGKCIKLYGTLQDVTERSYLIEKLQHSENLYRQAENLANMGNYVWNIVTNEVEWTDQLYIIYGLEPQSEKITLERFLSFVHPNDKEVIEKSLEHFYTEKSFDYTFRIVTANGETKTLRSIAQMQEDENGKPVRVIGTEQDVTNQYRIQQELKENQNFIRKIADATPSIITSYNINTGKYSFISEGLEKLLGYNVTTALQGGLEFFTNLVHPEDVNDLIRKNTEALEEANNEPDHNDIVVEFVYRMRHNNGNYRWFHTYGTIFDRNSAGLVEHILNISLDVTDQIEASKKIEEQEHFIQHIADASPTILYVYDVQKDCIAYVNREIYFVLGYTPEEINEMGDEVTKLLYHPDDIHLLPERKLSNKKISESDIMVQYECRMKQKEGDWQWFLVREVVFKTDSDDKVIQMIGAALDITKRKEMEKTLLQNSYQLEQSNASLEEFAYVASHDLKEPLRKISTFGDRLVAIQGDDLSNEGKIYLKKIVDASQRMQTMINDLLSISMISGNKSFEEYSLQQVLEEVLQTLEYKIEQKNAIVEADTLPSAQIIPSQFRQLFQNLLSNSLKFVREEMQPVITIRHSYLSFSEVSKYQVSAADRYLKIDFADNGIGFENEYAGRIFAIFQRLHGRSEYEGSGIGLAICKKIVEHHGGAIYASGQPNNGATFTIILPA